MAVVSGLDVRTGKLERLPGIVSCRVCGGNEPTSAVPKVLDERRTPLCALWAPVAVRAWTD